MPQASLKLRHLPFVAGAGNERGHTMELAGKRAVIVGGSRGLGLGLVEALVGRGAQVTAVARGAEALASANARLPIKTVAADASDADTARRVVGDVQPDLLVISAGSPPPMGRIDQISWDDYSANWNADTKIGLHWVQAALTLPMAPGGLVVLVSSGAAVNGSPLSGGYAGAKRGLWFIADYAEALADQLRLGLRFRILVPRQIVAGTGTGDAGLTGYAAASGTSYAEQAAKWPAMSPFDYGMMVTQAIAASGLAEAKQFGIRGDTGVTAIS
jgi:NAD(P)-dependent dehydrogenase (short-subunit alcohol dehydrogenase family)